MSTHACNTTLCYFKLGLDSINLVGGQTALMLPWLTTFIFSLGKDFAFLQRPRPCSALAIGMQIHMMPSLTTRHPTNFITFAVFTACHMPRTQAPEAKFIAFCKPPTFLYSCMEKHCTIINWMFTHGAHRTLDRWRGCDRRFRMCHIDRDAEAGFSWILEAGNRSWVSHRPIQDDSLFLVSFTTCSRRSYDGLILPVSLPFTANLEYRVFSDRGNCK